MLNCLRRKSSKELVSISFLTPSFLSSMGPSKDGVLIGDDFGEDADLSAGLRRNLKRAAQPTNYQVMMGLVDDETSLYFKESEKREGIGPDTRDKYLRTLVRNSYDFHLNEIFATVQNEYTDWLGNDGDIRPRKLLSLASHALTDKLYLAPLIQTASWCDRSGFPVYFYVFGKDEHRDEVSASPTSFSYWSSQLHLQLSLSGYRQALFQLFPPPSTENIGCDNKRHKTWLDCPEASERRRTRNQRVFLLRPIRSEASLDGAVKT